MSKSLNRVTLIGNLGTDPELRNAGKSRAATLSLATSKSWKDDKGDKQERVEWHRIVLWDALAVLAEEYFHKGDRLYVEGEIQYKTWEDKEGVTRYSTEIHGQNVIMLGVPPKVSENSRKQDNDTGAKHREKDARGQNA